jgi:hypothetical protein
MARVPPRPEMLPDRPAVRAAPARPSQFARDALRIGGDVTRRSER